MIVREKEDASFAWGKESSNIRIPKDRTVISIIRTLPEPIWISPFVCLAMPSAVSGMKKRESKSETFSANPFEYEFLYAPLGDKGAYAYQQPWYGFSVNKDSEEKEIAVEFLRFMMQEKEIDEMASIKGLPSMAENGTDERYAGLRDAKSIEASFINDGSVPDSIRVALEQVCNDFGAGVYGNANEAVQAFVELCAEK